MIVIVVVVVLRDLGALARTAHALGAAALRSCRTASTRLFAAPTGLELLGLVPREQDRDVRGALAHAEVATAGTRLPRLAGRSFVGPGTRDEQLVGRELL